MAKAKRNVWEFNFAQLPEVRDRIGNHFKAKLKALRRQRQLLDEEWMKYAMAWNVQKDGNHTYNGRANLYVPEIRKNVESQARQMTELAFPNEDFFNCFVGKNGTAQGAMIQKEMRRWQIQQAQLRPKYHKFCRQEALLGTSPVYIPWRKEMEQVFRRAKDKNGKIRPTREMIELYNGPDFIPRPLTRWYPLNPKSADFHRHGCVEFFEVDRFDLKAEEKKKLLHGLNDILERKNQDVFKMEEFERDIELAEANNLLLTDEGLAGEANLSADEDADKGGHLCALIFARIELPEACEDNEDPEMPIPVMIRIYDNEHVGTIVRNQFWHQRPPYLVGKYIPEGIDEFYGQGLAKAILSMQYEINSKAEQGMDSATLALNPIAFIDPGLAAQLGDFEVAPGAKWFVSPQGVKLGSIPDVTPVAYQAMGFLSGKMAEYSDRTPALPPALQGKARTATQSEIVDRAFGIDTKAFQMQNEILVLNPMMEMWESLTEQNIEEDQVIMVLGSRATDWRRAIYSPNASLGRYTYMWKVASTLQNKQIMARQIIDMMKVAATLPPEALQELAPKWAKIYKMIWTEGLSLPDADTLFGRAEIVIQDPAIEHKMLALGLELEVLPGDNDDKHSIDHDAEVKKLMKAGKKELAEELMQHILKHQASKEKKAQQAQLMAEIQRRNMAMQQAQQNAPKQGRSQGSGNRTQLSPNTSTGNMASGVRA